MLHSLVILILLVLVVPSTILSYGATSDFIGITLSNSCITLLQNNFSTTCPTYEELKALDSSNTKVSGKFETIDGWHQRTSSDYKNSWRYYDDDPRIRIFVDPPKGMNDKIDMIEIQPNFDTYLLAKDNNITNNTRTVYHDRYIDNCKNAIINAEKWKLLLADTIYFMRNNCNDNFTLFNHIETIYVEYVDHDISTSRKYIHEKWLEEVKTYCIFKYASC